LCYIFVAQKFIKYFSMKHLYDLSPLEQLFTEHHGSQLIADHIQTFLYATRREMSPETLEALDEEHGSLILLKLALRKTKPLK
jgi:hypothetical protein